MRHLYLRYLLLLENVTNNITNLYSTLIGHYVVTEQSLLPKSHIPQIYLSKVDAFQRKN